MESIPGKLPQMDGWAQNGWFSDDSLHNYKRFCIVYIYIWICFTWSYYQNVDDLDFPSVQRKLQDRCVGGSTLSIHIQAASVVTKMMVPAQNLGQMPHVSWWFLLVSTWLWHMANLNTLNHRIKQPAIIDEVVSYFVIIHKAASSQWSTKLMASAKEHSIFPNKRLRSRLSCQEKIMCS